MARGPNNQSIPDQDGLTPEVFAKVDWGKAVEADGKVNLQKIAGVSDEIKKKIIDILSKGQMGGVPGVEMALEDGAKSSPEYVSPMDEAAKAKFYRKIARELYGDLFGIDVNMSDEDLGAGNEVGTDSVAAFNRYLKLQLRVKEGKPDFTKRDDLAVGVNVLRELATEGGVDVATVLDDKVMESLSPADMFAEERNAANSESGLVKLVDASKFLAEVTLKQHEEYVEKLSKETIKINGKDEKIEDKMAVINQLTRKKESLKSQREMLKKEKGEYSPAEAGEIKRLSEDIAKCDEEWTVADQVDSAFKKRVKATNEFATLMGELLKQLTVSAKNKCFEPADCDTINKQWTIFNGLDLPDDYVKLKGIFAEVKGLFADNKRVAALSVSDKRREELADKLRVDKKRLEFSKKSAEGNTDLTDSAFALRIIKYKLLKDPENAKLSLEDLEKLAKRTLVEKLWERKNGKAIGEVVDGVESDLLKVIRDAVMKEKVLKFNYKVGDSKKELFKGITPDDLKDKESIERLFGSGKMDIKKAFMLLGLIGGEGGANTPQYKILQKKIFDLLGEQGLTPAQSMKAFREQMEKINAVVSQYSSNYGKTSAIDKELKELKLKKSMEKYRRGELDYEQLQDELEDAGIFKDGKLQEGSVSKLELYSGYVLNHRYAEKFKGRAWDATRDTGKFLGWNLLAAPLFLGGKWAVKGGLSLAGSAVAAPFRLLGYPLALLKAPLHILRHPIKVFTKPGEVFKGAGAKVTEKWVAKAKAGTDRRAKKWAAAGAELGKWKEPFKDPKYNWKSYEDRVKGKPSKDLGKMDARIERLKKKADETAFVLGEEPFLDYSKYKTNTNEEVKKAA